MGTRRNSQVLQNIRIGDRITAEYLNAITAALNANTRALHGPRAVTSTGTGGAGTALNLDFTESSRTQTTVELTDSNGDTVDVDQIDTVTFTNLTGEIMVLTFNNP